MSERIGTSSRVFNSTYAKDPMAVSDKRAIAPRRSVAVCIQQMHELCIIAAFGALPSLNPLGRPSVQVPVSRSQVEALDFNTASKKGRDRREMLHPSVNRRATEAYGR
uniref:Uncharacterized protein n=1 Tax=Sphaerodactylus townsendi TaxID=933632 RepID=A0ACB8G648_9SAUR